MGKLLRNGGEDYHYQQYNVTIRKDRQLKEQFIHGLNVTKMLRKIIRELTKIHENEEITSGNVLSWAKKVEA